MFFRSLAEELQKHIFSLLDPKDLLNTTLVCKQWKTLSDSEVLWHKFGVRSKLQFLKFVHSRNKLAKSIVNKKKSNDRLEINLYGFANNEELCNKLIPLCRWFSECEKKITSFLETIRINEYRFSAWHLFHTTDLKFNKNIASYEESQIALIHIANKTEIKAYFELLDKISSKSLLFVVTQDEQLSRDFPNTILFEKNDDLYLFYSKVTTEIEKIAGLSQQQRPVRVLTT